VCVYPQTSTRALRNLRAVEGAATNQAQVCGAADRIDVWWLYDLRDVAFDSS
jgi:hypothetical protein